MNITGIGERIVRLREEKNWSQSELAKRVFLNKSVMSRIESEERPIRDHELHMIASVLDTSSDFLLGHELTEEKSPYSTSNIYQDIIDALGLSELPLKDIHILSNMSDKNKNEIAHFIKYMIHRASEETTKNQ